MRRNLLKPRKEVPKPEQWKILFKTMCKSQGKCCKLIIDNGSIDNLVSIEMVEKLGLKRERHPTPYRVSWLQKGHQVLVNEQCKVDFQIGNYKDQVICDVIPMDVCHVLLGRPWQYDRNVMYNGRENTFILEKEGRRHTLVPLKDEKVEGQTSPKKLLVKEK